MGNSDIDANPVRAPCAMPHRVETAPGPGNLLVAVVDDDDSIRFLVQTLLERDGLQAVTYASGEAFLAEVDPEAVGCVVLDLHLPCLNGLEVQEILARRSIRIPVLVFTAQGSIPKAVAALKNGAVDFVEKPFDNKDLLRRIRACLDTAATWRRQSDASRTSALKLAVLTAREREVMDRIVAGRLNKHIADELRICVKTVEFHRSKIMQKLGAHSVAELVQLTVSSRTDRAPLGEHA